ncbi:GFA family protein [Qipengyuania flava]|uniref:GFA family protein n=1 Tax=Qipengyuania flava TaxID=192812 RepID=UPI001C62F726|nr:GFA family protein [Qipengyuania flava]QYJ06319.1 GFA family protein [Qipengyuania flava]
MEARCQCGQLTATITGEGHGVMCHCKACQRRSGSPFGMMVYFAAEDVKLSGTSTQYTRTADSGDDLTHGFCPVCGTPFWLKTAKHPAGIGIAVGAIESNESAGPVRSVFEENRHPWVEVPDTAQRFPRGRDGR